MSKRKRYSAEEKMNILKEIVEKGTPVSLASEQHGVHPNNIFKWRKEMLENAVLTFQTKRADISVKAKDRQISELESKVKQKDEVIAELAEELLALKKKTCGR